MRRVLPLLLAALAACQVDVEGARCQSAEHCPAGQGCGVDERCSTLALACALETVGARTRDCGQDGLVCGQRDGTPSCECPPHEGPEFAVAAPGSASEPETLAPTGAAEPPECRFRSLTAAIAAATNAGGGSVVAMGGTSEQRVTFGVATGETLPIDVPSGVTVTSDFASSGAQYVIRLDDPEATAAVRMHADGRLTGFAIENVAGDEARDAVELACDGSSAPVQLQSVTMSGTSAEDGQKVLGRGLSIEGTCGVIAADVVITGFQSDAVHVDAADSSVESRFLRGALEASGRGAHLKQGVLTLDGVLVKGNAGKGVEADSSGETALALSAVKVLGNGDTGLAVMNATRLSIVDSTIFDNGDGTSPTVWGPPNFPNSTGTARLCGGIVLIGAPPPAAAVRFERNRVYSNRGDQVLVMLSGGATWPLGAAACGATSTDTTVFGCYDTSSSGSSVSFRGFVAIDAIAEVNKTAWNSGVAYPAPATDYKAFSATGTSSVLLTGTPSYCTLPAELDCSTPDPK